MNIRKKRVRANGSAATVEKQTQNLPQNSTRSNLRFRLPASWLPVIDSAAASLRKSRDELITDAIREKVQPPKDLAQLHSGKQRPECWEAALCLRIGLLEDPVDKAVALLHLLAGELELLMPDNQTGEIAGMRSLAEATLSELKTNYKIVASLAEAK
jgi:hypothetical protein